MSGKRIKVGRLFRVTTITDPEAIMKKENIWLVVAVVDDAVCFQDQSEVSKFNNAMPLFWLRLSEVEENGNLELINA